MDGIRDNGGEKITLRRRGAGVTLLPAQRPGRPLPPPLPALCATGLGPAWCHLPRLACAADQHARAPASPPRRSSPTQPAAPSRACPHWRLPSLPLSTLPSPALLAAIPMTLAQQHLSRNRIMVLFSSGRKSVNYSLLKVIK